MSACEGKLMQNWVQAPGVRGTSWKVSLSIAVTSSQKKSISQLYNADRVKTAVPK